MILRGELSGEITAKHIQELADAHHNARITEYQRRYDEYQGIVTYPKDQEFDLEKAKRYFPQRTGGKKPEQDDVYLERLESAVWATFPQIIPATLTNLVLSDPMSAEFVPVDDQYADEAERANEIWNLTADKNKFGKLHHSTLEQTLGIGEMCYWPEHRSIDRFTGQKFEVGGYVKWAPYFPWFAHPIVNVEYVDEIIGSVLVYTRDNTSAGPIKPLLSGSTLSDGSEIVAQVYMSPLYNESESTPGFYRKYIDDNLVSGEEWTNKNWYECNPVVHMTAPDPDESGYRGKSWNDRIRHLSLRWSQMMSTVNRALDLSPNMWKIITSDPSSVKEFTARMGETIVLKTSDDLGAAGARPAEPDVAQIAREIEQTFEFKVMENIKHMIGQTGSVPAELIGNLEGIGKIAQSAVAMKVLWGPLIEAVGLVRKSDREARRDLMRNTIKMNNYGAPSKYVINLDHVNPVITYNDDLIPTDEKQVVENRKAREDAGWIERRDNVKYYNDGLDTDEQVDEKITEIDKQRTRARNLNRNRPVPPRNGRPEEPRSES